MALPSTTPANFPQGNDVVIITLIDYIVDSYGDMPSNSSRLIERTDEFGDYAESQTRTGSSAIVATWTLQRAVNSTILPEQGTQFTHDFDRSGTPSTIEVMNVIVSRSKDEADVFQCEMKLIAYQG